MTLLEQLDKAMPGWRLEYDNNPMDAALDLGLIEGTDVDYATTYRPLNFRDADTVWERLEQGWQEDATTADDERDDS